ncbi:MAG: alanine--tRNA ligase [Candidatus Omnitrophica bacterium]|nr:alanine--tRNA ligase [Candidatus Omnitrophota bacterium]
MMMTSNEIRKIFLDFFKEKNHRIVPGYALVPDDPTLLFTSAGMVQFKSLWVEKKPLPFSRAVTVQKCLRAGGKDSDLENVGKSVKHHSFLEMLGNFSFGDYFKKEAISWAWEFLIKILKLPKENLWVSVYEKDRESFQIWQKIIEVRKIVFLGKEDNFWGPAGDSGPCGPCSEIYFDFGEEFGCGKKSCQPGCSCRRFLEFWNLVFPQFDQRGGKLLPLGRPGVDTGMGLERIASICQGKTNDYETDLFTPIIEEIKTLANIEYGKQKTKDAAVQIIADHIRAVVFAISEEIYPENIGRGYVIRRVIRRAARAGRTLGIKVPFLYRLVPVVAGIMQEPYPYLSKKSKEISRIIKKEEERFAELLDSGKDLFMQAVSSLKGSKVLSGEVLFRLYDTYGLPLDLAEEMAKERGLIIDRDGFAKLIEKQRERGRKVSKFVSSEVIPEESKDITGKDLKRTVFVGYDKESIKTKILGVFQVTPPPISSPLEGED